MFLEVEGDGNSPCIMQFMQPDSVIPNPANPQAWNRYSYVLNNPIKYNDPSGHNADCGIGEGCLIGHGNPNDKPSQVRKKDRSEYLRNVARKFDIKLPSGYKFVYAVRGTSKVPNMLGVQQFFSGENGSTYYPFKLPDGTSVNPSIDGAKIDYNIYISSNLFDGTSDSPAAQNPDDVAMILLHEGDHAALEANIRIAIVAGGDSSMSSRAWLDARINIIEGHAFQASLDAVDSGRLHPSVDMKNLFIGKNNTANRGADGWLWDEPAVPSFLWGSP